MGRHGNTREAKRRRVSMHRRSRTARLAARKGRPSLTWDRDHWLRQMADQAVTPQAQAAVAELENLPPLHLGGRRNKPQEHPQKPKESGRGGRGGKGGKPGGKK